MAFVKIKEWRKHSVDKLVSDWSMSVKAEAPHSFYDSYDGRMCMYAYFGLGFLHLSINNIDFCFHCFSPFFWYSNPFFNGKNCD